MRSDSVPGPDDPGRGYVNPPGLSRRLCCAPAGWTAWSLIAWSCHALRRWTETFGPMRVRGQETLAQQVGQETMAQQVGQETLAQHE
jgi:hypothetical protein